MVVVKWRFISHVHIFPMTSQNRYYDLPLETCHLKISLANDWTNL